MFRNVLFNELSPAILNTRNESCNNEKIDFQPKMESEEVADENNFNGLPTAVETISKLIQL